MVQREFDEEKRSEPSSSQVAAVAREVERSDANARWFEERLTRAVVPITVGSGALSLVPWEPARAVGQGLLIASASTGMAGYVWASHRARLGARAEANARRASSAEAALLRAMEQSAYLRIVPFGRMRAAHASVRAIAHAAATGNPLVVRKTARWAQPAMTSLAGRSSKRLEHALGVTLEAIDRWEKPLDRVGGRIALLETMETLHSDHLGRLIAEIGVDLYQSAEELTGVIALSPEENEVLRDVIGEQRGVNTVTTLLHHASEALAEGFASECIFRGGTAADVLVRSVIHKHLVPEPMVLGAYAIAMQRSGDDRASVFRALLDRGGSDCVAALAMIGIRRAAPGRDPLGR